MKYPKEDSLNTEPEVIRVGDLVWWNEGVCVGFIEDVMEAPEDYERWGLEEPSIALTNLHPFHANGEKHKQHINSVISGGRVVNSAAQLAEEGLGLLSQHEQAELEWAILEAKRRVEPKYRGAPYCVSAIMDIGRREEDWHFHFVDQECKVLDTVVFPFRPNTRHKGKQADAGNPAKPGAHILDDLSDTRRMTKDEMLKLLTLELARFRSWTYAALAERIERDKRNHDCLDHIEVIKTNGTAYQIELNAFWDDKPQGNIRVCASLSAEPQRKLLGFLPIYLPNVTDSFIMSPEGAFVDEDDNP